MQPVPLRLSQTLWSAFRAANPANKKRLSIPSSRPFSYVVPPCTSSALRPPRQSIAQQARYYSSEKSETDRKVEEAKARIEESLDARADLAAQSDDKLKDPKDETIVHTIPESSSIVYTKEHESTSSSAAPSASAVPPPPPRTPPSQNGDPADRFLPSELSKRYSELRKRFTHLMDNYQTHIFTASQRLNDLTGYSGIEALKKQIESLETQVQNSRQSVKECRDRYSEAIATRSTTQREVNDLLHRKHTWSPTDLERFTSLYRSDHANEQAEIVAQKEVADAEAQYEEASTKLAKSILARYHEEQIWSDKIRQMSTWGTWGLMGINVLLFVIFQIAVEPWRRKRLVKGFEEKVEVALRERDAELAAIKASSGYGQTLQPNQSTAEGIAQLSATEKAEAVADKIAEQIVDAVSGATEDDGPSQSTTLASTSLNQDSTSSPQPDAATKITPSISELEAAAESVTSQELDSTVFSPDQEPTSTEPEPTSPSPSPFSLSLSSRWTSPSSSLAWYEDWIRARFSDDRHVMLTQRELTTVAMEGVAGGMAIMGLLFVLLRPR
ncbi:hypothetical protein PV10_04712 [Exophiala mesophila]|uniref:Sensitive to high expression protein 9, mitochondrial n=1 Tax=Exophiala mesophila TaxID=212818 RepID=A0A0D1XZ72_EXOME|nr:uncharacterized protein PV10_04712 [Exophiala mesophila]KIV93501.1 hypothetical protein PV10_04712 [Exophiala mesophila]